MGITQYTGIKGGLDSEFLGLVQQWLDEFGRIKTKNCPFWWINFISKSLMKP